MCHFDPRIIQGQSDLRLRGRTLFQNRACDFHRTRLLSNPSLVKISPKQLFSFANVQDYSALLTQASLRKLIRVPHGLYSSYKEESSSYLGDLFSLGRDGFK